MSTLTHIPEGYMRFVPAHKQSDGATSDLSPARWPVEYVFIAIEKERETCIDENRIQTILIPVIQATCRLTPATTPIFPFTTPR